MNINKVVTSVKEGEQDTLFEVYRKYRNDFIHWAANSYGAPGDLAISILQDVLLTFYMNIGSGRINELPFDLKSYLFQNGKNKLINKLQVRSAEYASTRHDSSGTEIIGIQLAALESSRVTARLSADKSDRGHQKVLRLYYVQTLSDKEVAKIMGFKNGETARRKRSEAIQDFAKFSTPPAELVAKNLDEIHNYLFGSMVEGERALFQARILIDEDLGQQVQTFEEVVNKFKNLDLSNLLHGFQSVDGQLGGSVAGKRKSPLVLSAAAAILVLLTVGVYFSSAILKSRQIAGFEIHDAGLPVVMGKSEVNFDNAMSYYKLHEYQKSLDILNQLPSGEANDTLNYYRGVNHYLLKDYLSATKSFKLVDSRSSLYTKARYQLGLSYWQLDEIADARRIFTSLKAVESPYKDQIDRILHKLEE